MYNNNNQFKQSLLTWNSTHSFDHNDEIYERNVTFSVFFGGQFFVSWKRIWQDVCVSDDVVQMLSQQRAPQTEQADDG